MAKIGNERPLIDKTGNFTAVTLWVKMIDSHEERAFFRPTLEPDWSAQTLSRSKSWAQHVLVRDWLRGSPPG